MKTVRRVGRVAVAFVEDAQGRRVAVGDVGASGDVVEMSIVLATNKAELRDVISELRSLVGDLPDPPTGS